MKEKEFDMLPVRMPVRLKKALLARAKKNERNMTTELIFILKKALKVEI